MRYNTVDLGSISGHIRKEICNEENLKVFNNRDDLKVFTTVASREIETTGLTQQACFEAK